MIEKPIFNNTDAEKTPEEREHDLLVEKAKRIKTYLDQDLYIEIGRANKMNRADQIIASGTGVDKPFDKLNEDEQIDFEKAKGLEEKGDLERARIFYETSRQLAKVTEILTKLAEKAEEEKDLVKAVFYNVELGNLEKARSIGEPLIKELREKGEDKEADKVVGYLTRLEKRELWAAE